MTKSDNPPFSKYGTTEYYAEYFSDVIADAGDDGNPEAGHRIMLAFRMAIEDWLNYHKTAAKTYEELLYKFLSNYPGTN